MTYGGTGRTEMLPDEEKSSATLVTLGNNVVFSLSHSFHRLKHLFSMSMVTLRQTKNAMLSHLFDSFSFTVFLQKYPSTLLP